MRLLQPWKVRTSRLTAPAPRKQGRERAPARRSPEAEEPLVETRVVPDDPVEVTDEPAGVTGVEEAEEPAEEAKPAVIPPSFDTVRITPDGRAVIAGRAAPAAEVSVRSETVDLGSETANRQGEWTLVPLFAIPPGHHEFLAIATMPDGTQVESDHALIVSVPDPDEEDGSVLAVLVPRDGVGSSIVVQKPRAQGGRDRSRRPGRFGDRRRSCRRAGCGRRGRLNRLTPMRPRQRLRPDRLTPTT